MSRPATVRSELQLSLVMPGATAVPVRARMAYDIADPYAVTVAFHTGAHDDDEAVEWTFARQLLTDGVSTAVGQGDVQVWPAVSDEGPIVGLALSSPSGKATFEIRVPELVEFLALTYDAVPTGTESDHVDVDAELALLLWANPET